MDSFEIDKLIAEGSSAGGHRGLTRPAARGVHGSRRDPTQGKRNSKLGQLKFTTAYTQSYIDC